MIDKAIHASNPAQLLEATDGQIEEVAMELFVGYCFRLSENKIIKRQQREDWARLGMKVKAIVDLRYGKPVAIPPILKTKEAANEPTTK